MATSACRSCSGRSAASAWWPGPLGLLISRERRDPALGDPAQRGLDSSLLVLLLVTSATGLALLALRHTVALRPLLCLHLGAVLAFFVAIPYSKFVHGFYRLLALVHAGDEGGGTLLSLKGDQPIISTVYALLPHPETRSGDRRLRATKPCRARCCACALHRPEPVEMQSAERQAARVSSRRREAAERAAERTGPIVLAIRVEENPERSADRRSCLRERGRHRHAETLIGSEVR